MRQILGILLVIVGVAYITFHGFRYTAQEKVLDIGPLEATTNTHKEILPYSPMLGGAIIAGGALLFLVGFTRRTS